MSLPRILFALVILASFAPASHAEDVKQAVELFNGKDLTGWTKRGGDASYSIEDGAIVGRSKPDTPNTFLATDKEYGDFELNLDFKIDDPKFNSGVQIRSHARQEAGQERVFGYQVEIDPRTDRGWTAGIYYEYGSDARKAGWLNDLANNEAARNAFKIGEWNHLRIVAQGRRIQTWLNGVPASDFTDNDDKAFAPSGFIALQVHSVGGDKEPKEIRWRNIKITELGATGDPAKKEAAAGFKLFGRVMGAMLGFDTSGGAAEEEPSPLLGQPAPNFELEAASGEKVSLKDLRGNVVVLDFWATWCGPCVRALPALEKLHQATNGKAVRIIGVNQRDERDAILEMVKNRGTTFTHVMDTDGAVGDAFGVSGIPQTVVIDANGIVQAVHVGYSPTLETTLASAVDKLLAGENLYDERAIAAKRAKHDQRRAEIEAELGLKNSERLRPLGTVLSDPNLNLTGGYYAPVWRDLSGDGSPSLIMRASDHELIVYRPIDRRAEKVRLDSFEDYSFWQFAPVVTKDGTLWAITAVQYGDRDEPTKIKLVVAGSDGKTVWSHDYPSFAEESQPQTALATCDLTGDGNDEIIFLAEHDELARANLAGPDGAERVLSIFDATGEKLLRTWVPGEGGTAIFALEEPDGKTLLMSSGEGLNRYRFEL